MINGLLTDSMEKCVMIDKRTVDSPSGGFETIYVDGAAFFASVSVNNTVEAKIAEKMGVTELYKVITGKEDNLHYHDVFRRESDGQVFRVTSNGDDTKTPKSATLDMRVVTAEKYELPDG